MDARVKPGHDIVHMEAYGAERDKNGNDHR